MSPKQIIRRLQRLAQTISDSRAVRNMPDGDYMTENVPYTCQFPSPEHVQAELEGTRAIHDDPEWRSFGFTTEKEIDYWAPRLCGIACVKMLVDYSGAEASVAKLTEQGVGLGGYDTEHDKGWYYKPLVALLSRYGVEAVSVPYLSIHSVASLVHDGRLVIASVNPQIIRGDTTITSRARSGHLVVVVGVRVKRGHIEGLYVHNPSGKTPDMQKYAYVLLETFRAAYGERGIVVKVPHYD